MSNSSVFCRWCSVMRSFQHWGAQLINWVETCVLYTPAEHLKDFHWSLAFYFTTCRLFRQSVFKPFILCFEDRAGERKPHSGRFFVIFGIIKSFFTVQVVHVYWWCFFFPHPTVASLWKVLIMDCTILRMYVHELLVFVDGKLNSREQEVICFRDAPYGSHHMYHTCINWWSFFFRSM